MQNSADLVGKTRLMFDLAHLAIQTDSTRLVTMMLLGTSQVPRSSIIASHTLPRKPDAPVNQKRQQK